MVQIFGQNMGSPYAIVDTEGRLYVNATISGGIHIGSVSANVDSIYVQSGLITIQDEIPTDESKNNPAWEFVYIISGTVAGVTGSSIGSIVQHIDTGSYVQIVTWDNNLIVNIGSYS